MPTHSSLTKYRRRKIVKVDGQCGHCHEEITISVGADSDYDIEEQTDLKNYFLICPECLDEKPDTLWPYLDFSELYH